MKKILGLDLGTNSVGWALINQDESKSEVVGLGSRIIPMSQDILGEFDRGNSVSQTAERTGYRGTRRLRERYLLRRERLHRVLNILNFLPEHYGKSIDFEQHFGKFIDESEPKIAYRRNEVTGKMEFAFMNSFNEMVANFKLTQPHLVGEGRQVPHGQKQKVEVKQVKGDSWAIRKPMHKDTVSGRVTLRFQKAVNLSVAIDTPEFIVDKSLKAKVKELLAIPYDKKQIAKYFKENDNQWNGKPVSKVEVYYFDGENAASRIKVDETFNSEKIKKITDTGIQRILLNHLQQYSENQNGKVVEHPEIAFTSDGLEAMNRNIQNLNNGIYHQPIYKVRTYEPMGSKFAVGTIGNKGTKFVEAAKGTNLFFAIYLSPSGKRSYETVPLNVVIEREKQGLSPVPEHDEKGNALLFYLSPNDLVYIPTQEEQDSPQSVDLERLTKEQVLNVYKVVSFTGNRMYAIPANVAQSIVDKVEYTQLNKVESDVILKRSIKEICWKLKVDRLGNVVDVIR